MPLALHKTTIGVAPNSVTYYFLQPEGNYEGDVATLTGVTAEEGETDEPLTPVKELLRRGILLRIVIDHGSTANRRSARLLCQRSKLSECLDDLPDATFKGRDILSARVPRRATFL